MIQMAWELKPFARLTADEVYEVLKLRVDVFVVEQACPYPEIDGRDRHPETLHLIGKTAGKEILAYLRILPPGLSFTPAGIGRVVVAKSIRGRGICTVMVKKALDHINQVWPGEAIGISAQVYLKAFYASHGFKPVSESYLEDGIPHIDMIRPAG